VTGAERRRRLAGTRVYLVVTEAACGGRPWEDAAREALASGVVGMVQLREKDLDDQAFLARARVLRSLAEASRALLILNDRVHLVDEAGADGAHVGEADLAPKDARAGLGPDLLLGVSTHDADEVARAPHDGADYAGLGPCFPTTTKTLARPPLDAARLEAALRAARLPVFPIGGITPDRVGSLRRAGAKRVAVGAGILAAPSPGDAARRTAAALP
jgi:thiamine-phosphate pyrophosphorylase